MAMLSLSKASANAAVGVSPDSDFMLDVRSNNGYRVYARLGSARALLTLGPSAYRRFIEALSPSLAKDLQAALLALPFRTDFRFTCDDDTCNTYIQLDDLRIAAWRSCDYRHGDWQCLELNAALAALDPDRDAVLIRMLTAIRDVLLA